MRYVLLSRGFEIRLRIESIYSLLETEDVNVGKVYSLDHSTSAGLFALTAFRISHDREDWCRDFC